MQFRNPTGAYAPVAAYSHQVEVPADARWLVLSGQIGMRPDGTVPAEATEQIGVALDNIRRNLETAGTEIGDLVKLTVYLVGDIDADARRQVLSIFLGAHKPSMTLLYVSALASPVLKVEIDAWAAREMSWR